MSELPQGWVLVPLGTLIELNPKTIAVEDCTEVGFVPMALLGKRWFDVPGFELRQWASVKKGYTHFQNGDVLLAKITPCFENGKAGLIRGLPNGIGSGSTEYFVCRTNAGTLDSRYLLAYLKTDDFVHTGAMSMTGSVGHKRVPKEYLLGREIPLAPQREQTRIANQLDTLLTRVQACNDRFAAIPALLKRFRNSVLAAAVSGRLTGDLRSNDLITSNTTTTALWRIPASWTWVRADEVTGFITKGTTPSKEKMTSGSGEIPYIKVYNLGFDGRLDFNIDPTFVDSTTHSVDLKRSITLPGDVLMNIVGPPLGKVAIVPDSHQEWNINQAIARFRPVRGLRSQYLAHCLMSTELISHAVSQAKATVGQLNLTLEICRALPIPMPPEKEQTEIVRRVEALFALADRIEARCAAARAQAQRLSPLVLAKAFRGELVPQDPNDEPASALLARIGLAKAAAAKPEKKTPIARKQAARKTVI